MPTLLEELMREAHEIVNNNDAATGERKLREIMENVQEEQLRRHQKRKNDEEKFVEPKRTSKVPKKTQNPPPIVTQNSYEPLNNQENNDQMDQEPAANNTPATTKEETTRKTTKPTDNERKKYTIPPIFLKDKDKWMDVSRMIREKNIATTKCKLVNTGVQIDATTEEDYKKIKNLLKTSNIQYYTFQLKSEKPIKAVLRGVPQEITEEEVLNDLLLRNYPASKVKRMNGRDGKPSPLVFVEIPEQYRSIFETKTCCGLVITVEPKNIRRNVIQCHKCQMYGHIQRHCNVNHRCMKCGGEHSTHTCEKPKTTPPKCANCEGEHISTWLHCEKNPNNPKNRKTPAVAEPPRENIWKKRQEEREEKTKREREERQPTSNRDDILAVTLGRMMITLNATNATMEQKLHFIQQTEAITALFAERH